MMQAVAEMEKMRIDPNRSFSMATSKRNVYPYHNFYANPRSKQTVENCQSNATPITAIKLKDHFFDTPTRDSKKHRRKDGKIKSPFESAHGEQGVRQFHARDDSKIPAHRRLGLREIPDL